MIIIYDDFCLGNRLLVIFGDKNNPQIFKFRGLTVLNNVLFYFTIFEFFKVQKPMYVDTKSLFSFTVSKSFKVQKPQIPKKLNSSINLPNIWFLHLLVIDHQGHMTSHSPKFHLPLLIIPNLC